MEHLKRLAITCILGLSPLLIPAIASSQLEVLHGLREAAVVVEDLNPRLDGDGSKKAMFQADLESKIMMVGIRILPSEEIDSDKNAAFFYLQVDAFEPRPNYYVYSIRLTLIELVSLSRVNNKIWAGTYDLPIVMGTAGSWQEIRNRSQDQINRFVNDYLSANPE
jgi:hypothetical protein